MLLEHIGGPEDLKVLTYHQLDTLAQEIREFIAGISYIYGQNTT